MNLLNKRHFRLLCIILIGGGIVLWLLVQETARSTSYEKYVCPSCGTLRTLYVKQMGELTYWKKDLKFETAVSRLFLKHPHHQHEHQWRLMKWGHSFRKAFVGSYSDGGFASLPLLSALNDTQFAKQLEATANREIILQTLVEGYHSQPEAVHEVFRQWYDNRNTTSLGTFWASNGSAITQLVKSRANAREK